MQPLPVDAALPDIVRALAQSRAVVVTAAPGAGKTTRVAPALMGQGPLLMLQPRRAAARAVAARIAAERGWTLGQEVGWQMRFDRRFGDETRLLVATEGILTARLQRDPLLSEFRTLVIDEFHERSIHADLGLALARQAWLARDDFQIVVMSATLDAAPIARFLHDCPIIEVPGRTFPVSVDYAPGITVGAAALSLMRQTSGNVLCFVAGAADIHRTLTELSGLPLAAGTEVLPLHGGLTAAEQDRALGDSAQRRIVVATNIAETSVTVPGVTGVVDAGLHKVARYDAARAVDSLTTERIPQDAADQRTGRAGRTSPGTALRLWDRADRLRPAREPEVHRIDLAGSMLDLVACGENPEDFAWFDAPAADAISAALVLLERLGAVKERRLTTMGEQMRRLPLSPRLARTFVAGEGSRDVARACALLADTSLRLPAGIRSSSDVLTALDGWAERRDLHQMAANLERLASRLSPRDERTPQSQGSDTALRRALLAGFPDRVAHRREPGSDRCKLASGVGAILSAESGVRDAEWLLALEVTASTRPDSPDARIRAASAIDREWLAPTRAERETWIDESGGVRSALVSSYDTLVLSQTPVKPDLDAGVPLLVTAWLAQPTRPDDERLLRRLRFAAVPFELEALVRAAAAGCRAVAEIQLERGLSYADRARVTQDAPETMVVPSGRHVRLDYTPENGVLAEVKLQELFGLADTPRIGGRREPVALSLLAPNGRPVQVTRDLKSFWARTYPEVRKELRGRYPRHPWPEDPWTAIPTSRPKARGT